MPRPMTPEPASKIRTRSPQRISTQEVSAPKWQLGAAGAGALPRAPQIRTRNGGSVMPSACRGPLARFYQLRGRPGQAIGQHTSHLDCHFGKLPKQLKELLLADPERFQFAGRRYRRGAR